VIDDEPEEALLNRAMSNLPRPALIHLFRNQPPRVKGLRLTVPEPVQTQLDRFFAGRGPD
jgi:hypothetical protein